MIGRIGLIVLGAAAAAALTTAVPGVHSRLEQLAGARTVSPAGERAGGDDRRAAADPHEHGEADGKDHGKADRDHDDENILRLTARQIEAAGITLAKAGGGVVARVVSAPATVTADADRLVQVAAKIAGTLAEVRVKLGDRVAAGQVLAVIESREVAEAKSAFLAADRAEELARTNSSARAFCCARATLPSRLF